MRPFFFCNGGPMLVRLNTTIPGVGTAGATVSVPTAVAISLVDEGVARAVGESQSARIIAMSAVAVASAAVTPEQELAAVVLPAGLLGPNDGLRIACAFRLTNSGTLKRPAYKIGAKTIATSNGGGVDLLIHQNVLLNRGAVNSQFLFGGGILTDSFASLNGTPPVDPQVDFATDQTIRFTVEKATASDTAVLEGYVVELLTA